MFFIVLLNWHIITFFMKRSDSWCWKLWQIIISGVSGNFLLKCLLIWRLNIWVSYALKHALVQRFIGLIFNCKVILLRSHLRCGWCWYICLLLCLTHFFIHYFQNELFIVMNLRNLFRRLTFFCFKSIYLL